jgi:hypothetical protein
MARRLSALLGIAIVIGLVLTLMWRVYVHQQRNQSSDEPAIVQDGLEKLASRVT